MAYFCLNSTHSKLRMAHEAHIGPKIYKTTANIVGKKYKFGVQVPSSVRQALQLDKENGNTLWADAIQKEMDCLNKHSVFKLGDFSVGKPPEGYKKIPQHIVCDVKFDLRRQQKPYPA